MQVFTDPAAVPAGFGPSAVTVGKFDGVHVGHRAILEALHERSLARGHSSVVVTFDRNPLQILAPERCPLPLVSNPQKLDLLAESGVDAVLQLEFTLERSRQAPESFVDEVLVGALDARELLVGSDFRYGARGAGTVDTLRDEGARRGFEVVLIDDVLAGEQRASSTRIRAALDEGRVRDAAEMLGRPAGVRSVVVEGEKRGRELGYPTANLAADRLEGFVPRDGVYAAWLVVDGETHPAAVSIGNNPTFDGVPDKQVEAHALDRDFDLYGKSVEVLFVEWIRPMLKFSGVEELIERIRDDEAVTRRILAAEAPPARTARE